MVPASKPLTRLLRIHHFTNDGQPHTRIFTFSATTNARAELLERRLQYQVCKGFLAIGDPERICGTYYSPDRRPLRIVQGSRMGKLPEPYYSGHVYKALYRKVQEECKGIRDPVQ